MKTIIALITLLFSGIAYATPPICFPQTDIKIYATQDIEADRIAKSSFNKVLDRLEKHYAPAVKTKGYNLVITRLWDDPTVNSDTDVEGRNWVINSYGGLARYPGMTANGYALVACHELGHHLGGAPLYSGFGEWAATEGESDYWASRCMKELGYTKNQITAAAKSLGGVLADLDGDPAPNIKTPDLTVVRSTYEEHSNGQCRLDTYIQGLLCPSAGEMSQTNPRVNSCYLYPTSRTYASGSRPRCWFKP